MSASYSNFGPGETDKEVKERRELGERGSAGAQVMSRVGLDDDGEE